MLKSTGSYHKFLSEEAARQYMHKRNSNNSFFVEFQYCEICIWTRGALCNVTLFSSRGKNRTWIHRTVFISQLNRLLILQWHGIAAGVFRVVIIMHIDLLVPCSAVVQVRKRNAHVATEIQCSVDDSDLGDSRQRPHNTRGPNQRCFRAPWCSDGSLTRISLPCHIFALQLIGKYGKYLFLSKEKQPNHSTMT